MLDERNFERADELAQKERENGIKHSVAILAKSGSDNCIECCDPIGAKRKKAMPSTRHCITCQKVIENSNRHNEGVVQ